MQLVTVVKKAKKARYKKAADILLHDLYNATAELRKKVPDTIKSACPLYNKRYTEINTLVTWLMFQISSRNPKVCTTLREIDAINEALSMYRYYIHLSRKRKETRLYLEGQLLKEV